MIKMTHLYTKSVIVFRMKQISTTNKMSLTSVTGVACEIQPQEEKDGNKADGVYGKVFNLYYDGEVPIYESDILEDEFGNTYIVVGGGVSKRQQGNIGYTKLTIQLNNKGQD